MSDHVSIAEMAQAIRQIYAADPFEAESRIEAYLEEKLNAISAASWSCPHNRKNL